MILSNVAVRGISPMQAVLRARRKAESRQLRNLEARFSRKKLGHSVFIGSQENGIGGEVFDLDNGLGDVIRRCGAPMTWRWIAAVSPPIMDAKYLSRSKDSAELAVERLSQFWTDGKKIHGHPSHRRPEFRIEFAHGIRLTDGADS